MSKKKLVIKETNKGFIWEISLNGGLENFQLTGNNAFKSAVKAEIDFNRTYLDIKSIFTDNFHYEVVGE